MFFLLRSRIVEPVNPLSFLFLYVIVVPKRFMWSFYNICFKKKRFCGLTFVFALTQCAFVSYTYFTTINRFHNTRTQQKEQKILCWRLLIISFNVNLCLWLKYFFSLSLSLSLSQSLICGNPQEFPIIHIYHIFHTTQGIPTVGS